MLFGGRARIGPPELELSMSFRRRAAAIGVLTALPMLTVASPAFAHAGLVSTTPAADSVVTTSPPQVVLTFDEAVLDQGAGIVVTDASGTRYDTSGTLHYGGATLSVDLNPLSDAGTYTVAWTVVADDGDRQSQTYTFTYQPDGSGAATTAAAPSPVADQQSSGSGPGPAPWLVGGVIVVVVIMVVIVVMRRGRGGSDPSN
jgi:methionine-rich copper-binding protein CopC